jgi:transposase
MSFLEPHPSVVLFTGGKGMNQIRSFVGMDVHKDTISISVAEDGRGGPVRFIGVIPNAADDVAKMAKRLSKHGELDFCYEASGCGYGIHRQLTALGHKCIVVAPSMIPRKPGERIKTDRRDSEKLAILHRSGDLTPVWVPDIKHEALRDLVRARVDASMHLMRARQQLLAFLLRHGCSYPTGKHWTQRHRSWLAGQTFQEHAHGIVFQDYLETVWTAQQRRDALIDRISTMVGSWSLGPLVEALRGLRGIGMISAATFIASTDDLSRFESPRLLMGYLGLVPSEHSSGGTIRRGGITKTGNREARRMLIEAAWSTSIPPASRRRRRRSSSACPRRFAISHGRHRPGCVLAIAPWLPEARSRRLSSLRSRESLPASYGPSVKR